MILYLSNKTVKKGIFWESAAYIRITQTVFKIEFIFDSGFIL